jgi:Bacterial regulatory proteins, luxR family
VRRKCHDRLLARPLHRDSCLQARQELHEPGKSTYLQIAATLYIAYNTVKAHLRSIYQKLGVTSRSQAIKRQSTCACSEITPAVRPDSHVRSVAAPGPA